MYIAIKVDWIISVYFYPNAWTPFGPLYYQAVETRSSQLLLFHGLMQLRGVIYHNTAWVAVRWQHSQYRVFTVQWLLHIDLWCLQVKFYIWQEGAGNRPYLNVVDINGDVLKDIVASSRQRKQARLAGSDSPASQAVPPSVDECAEKQSPKGNSFSVVLRYWMRINPLLPTIPYMGHLKNVNFSEIDLGTNRLYKIRTYLWVV